ncbi:exopolysaccharide biosynthesis polyprenyl glycosylphosphotransferase [Puniceicoccaceae bacterium K14]|nr:exopolysaccharide biosynthesis polyprenyl glycosylphosphotransferase [Puniceicoccaceae bacterium K14]
MTNTRKEGLAAIQSIILAITTCFVFLAWAFVYSSFTDLIVFSEVPFVVCFTAILTASYFCYRRLKKELPSVSQFIWGRSLIIAINQSLITVGTLGVFLFAFDQDSLSRSFILIFVAIICVVLTPANYALPGLLLKLSISKDLKRRYLLIGSEKSLEVFSEWIEQERKLSAEVSCHLSIKSTGKDFDNIPYAGNITKLTEAIEKFNVSHIVLLESINSNSWFRHITRIAEANGCRLVIKNPLENMVGRKLRYFSEAEHQFFTLQKEPLENPANRLFKRFFDVVVSFPVVLFVLPPLCLFVWFRQRRESPGPLLFKQRRYGRNQEPFYIWKFRTMHHDFDDSPEAEARRALQQATEGDPRIYATGAFLRKTSLDEFPQFVNALLGQMSVVGPRPHPLKLDDSYSTKIDSYTSRHYVKPGITGLAQCKGFRGETAEKELMEQRIKHDIIYLENWNVFVDITLTLKTVKQVFRPLKSSY